MPLQSGSDKVLKDMRRSYRSNKFLGILDEVRAKLPHASITTDIIVGFPGETEEDFQATLDVVEKARFTSAYTFQYSPRPGTPAAEMDGQVPKEVVQERFERLLALQERISYEENLKLIGTSQELLVQETNEKKADRAQSTRLSGRARDGRLVHFDAGSLIDAVRPGDIVHTTITDARPFYLIADSRVTAHRRTLAGDNSEAGQVPTTAPVGVGLGMPKIGAPVAAPAAAGAADAGGACGSCG